MQKRATNAWTYDFHIKYRKGSDLREANALSLLLGKVMDSEESNPYLSRVKKLGRLPEMFQRFERSQI